MGRKTTLDMLDVKGTTKDRVEPRYNRLIHEKSPYLIQHAHNPVDWYPWGSEAFRQAEREDKPVFLSIGYSTCHWCHVMAHESFEDEEVAKLMNEVFVNIKVDREERPDIDGVYMTVCQLMTGSGGWPLTIVMTPDKKPFFAGTYFPRESRVGRIGMVELVQGIRKIWTTRREEVFSSAEQVLGTLRQLTAESGQGPEPDRSTLQKAFEDFSRRFDSVTGGFGDAPKFPSPHNLFFLLRHWKRTGESRALEMVEKTLEFMRRGGIYDHIGFGFHRYSTDSRWRLPHFEKMLYDQAMLSMAYLEAYQATGKPGYAETAEEIFTYVLRDMTSPDGGFYSAEDADSEGREGKFYLWSIDEVRRVLQKEEADLVIPMFGFHKDGNFVEEASGRRTGENIFHREKDFGQMADILGRPERELEEVFETARRKLFDVRRKRVHPHKDDKILTDWNGMMIAALARGAQVLDNPDYTEAAVSAAEFVLQHMRGAGGRLMHFHRDGHTSAPAHLDDYAFMVWGLLELYEAVFDVRYLKKAIEFNDHLLRHYWDAAGGFYFTSDDAEEILIRQKETYDGAIPAGNSVAMMNLMRLARITGNGEWEARAVSLARASARSIDQVPAAYAQLLAAVEFLQGPSYEIVVAGDPRKGDTQEMIRSLRKPFLPNKVVLLRPVGGHPSEIEKIASFTVPMKSRDGRATAYVCSGFSCQNPTADIAEMLKTLRV
ncbi:MAG TPA: thioredoxin domain-containing protein [Syntrophales bacterium]|nr:thioredoxin domain-containing protein [Syntrophales bacterium]HPI57506.1 thioredoxin domain-containing protein [Syntrophales bacterium]HPN24663.1 thioredoxin domain-containing protein [Syntrophales bacterium]HQM29794.1 thioredoxin domain-containing protein [Syntrophales bacterium]